MALNSRIILQTPRGAIKQQTNKNGKVKLQLVWDSRWGSRRTQQFSRAQMFVDSEVLRYSDPLTPRKLGQLILSGKLGTIIGSGVVRYMAPYAKRVYYGGHMNFTGAPQRGAKWFERMKVTHKTAILRGAGKIAGKS